MRPFTLLIKPSGSDCNMDCTYCFYKNRAPQVGSGRQRMSDKVLENLIKDYLELRLAVSAFAWQGGEPMLMGLDFYKRVVELQKKYGAAGQQVTNALQTNAVLLDDKWCRFLHEYNFLAGLSLDGPKEFHDYYRRDLSGGGTFDRVIRAIENCKKYRAEFNILVLLNNVNVEHPDELFDFFIENGIRYLQFVPCVEPAGAGGIADFSITSQQYGNFLCRIFDRWLTHGPTKLSIRSFDSILSYCLSGRHTVCTFSSRCSDYIVVEHTGDCFCCDFFVAPKWRLGSILETPVEQLVAGSKKRSFARAKQKLSGKCLLCRHLDICRGGCMKDRLGPDGKPSMENYFCQAYKQFFDYTMPKFMQLAATVRTG
jgi:uncharacterized protein